MWVPGAVFAGVLLVVLGAYWLLVVRQEEKFLERLKPSRQTSRAEKLRVLRPEDKLSSVGPLNEILKRFRVIADPLQESIVQSGLQITVGSLLLSSGCAALFAYLLVNFLTRQPLAGLLAGVIASMIPFFVVKRAKSKRVLKFEQQFPEAIDLVARALRAGHALPTGLGMVADELPHPVGTEFRMLYDEQNFGLTLPDALRNFAHRIPLLDARFFVTAVLTQRETGGNLAEVLDNLAQVIRERFKIKRQVRVISAHGRITGWVLILLPPSLAAATLVLNPHHLGTLTGDPLGVKMLITAASLQCLGTLIIRKIVNVEY